MRLFKCYDIVETVLDEVTDGANPIRSDQTVEKKVRNLCEELDVLIGVLKDGCLSIAIDQKTQDISLSVTCQKLELENHTFQVFNTLASSFKFYAIPQGDAEDNIEFKFIVSSVNTYGGDKV